MRVHVDEGWCLRMAQAEAASHPSGEIGAGRLAVDPEWCAECGGLGEVEGDDGPAPCPLCDGRGSIDIEETDDE